MKSLTIMIQFALSICVLPQFNSLQAQPPKCWTYVVIFKGIPNKSIWSDSREYNENTIYISNVINLCETDLSKIKDLKAQVMDKYGASKSSDIYPPDRPYDAFYLDKLDAVKAKNEFSGLMDDAKNDVGNHMYKWGGRFIIPAKTTIERITL